MSDAPYTFGQARDAAEAASKLQASAEEFVRDAARQLAAREEAYRVALAEKIVGLRAEGYAITACGDIARGDKRIAALKRDRDIAEGVQEAAKHAAFRRAADRRDTESFIAWSMRRDLAETPPVFDTPVIGARRVA